MMNTPKQEQTSEGKAPREIQLDACPYCEGEINNQQGKQYCRFCGKAIGNKAPRVQWKLQGFLKVDGWQTLETFSDSKLAQRRLDEINKDTPAYVGKYRLKSEGNAPRETEQQKEILSLVGETKRAIDTLWKIRKHKTFYQKMMQSKLEKKQEREGK